MSSPAIVTKLFVAMTEVFKAGTRCRYELARHARVFRQKPKVLSVDDDDL